MSYIAQSYSPSVLADDKIEFKGTKTHTTLERVCELAELAKKDIFPGPLYTNYEVQIWVLMRDCIEDAIESRNHYDDKKGVRQTSQLLQAL